MSKYSRPLYLKSPQMKGQDVKDVQKRLRNLGYSLGSIDGYYGPKTESAVKKYQKINKLEIDGIVGPKTWESLFDKNDDGYTRALYVTSPQIQGEDVKKVQRKLTDLGYGLGSVDGYYGPKTESAVKKYQKDKKLEVDGIVGSKTWESLFSKNTDNDKDKDNDKDNDDKDRVLYLTSPQMSGEDVKKLQNRLDELGYDVGSVDGYFGPKTESGVIRFQGINKLEVDGMVGPKTTEVLFSDKAKKNEVNQRGTKIYIDSGHGGKDPGASGNDLIEKEVVLQISKYQKDLFEAAGCIVKMSRSSDKTVSLSQRTKEANEWGADIFISNHCNAFNGKAYGCEVYYSIYGGDGKVYAENVVEALGSIFHNRGAKTRTTSSGADYYHVIREANMPAIIVEYAFIDNKNDAKFLGDKEDLMMLANLVVDAILK